MPFSTSLGATPSVKYAWKVNTVEGIRCTLVEGTTFLISILSLTILRPMAFFVVRLNYVSWIRREPTTSKEVSMG
jgi:hypothetical protein